MMTPEKEKEKENEHDQVVIDAGMKRYINGEIWEFEDDLGVSDGDNGVLLGLDGGTTSSVCIWNECLNLGDKTPLYMEPVAVGGLLQGMDKSLLPPAIAPAPPPTEDEVTEPPLPPLSKISPSSPISGARAPPPRNAQAKVTVCIFLSTLTLLVASLML